MDLQNISEKLVVDQLSQDSLNEHLKTIYDLTTDCNQKMYERDCYETEFKAFRAGLWEVTKNQTGDDGKPLSDARVNNKVDADPVICDMLDTLAEMTHTVRQYQNAITRFNDRKEFIKLHVSMTLAADI